MYTTTHKNEPSKLGLKLCIVNTKSRFCTGPYSYFCSILTPAQRKACTTAVKDEGFEAVDNALAQVKSEEATASVEADLKAIQALITQSHGGYTALNEAVKVRLRSWFQDITGAIGGSGFN